MKSILLACTTLLVAGCSSPAPEAAAPVTPDGQAGAHAPTGASAASVSQPGGGGGITPMTPTPIPNAPVAGTESLQGGGSAVGTVAKDRAKAAAAQASTPNMGTDSDGE